MGLSIRNFALTATLAAVWIAGVSVRGESPAFPNSPASFHQPTQPTNPALRYFGGRNAQAVYQQPQFRKQLPAPQPIQITRPSKPFSGRVRTSTITPYLNLDNIQTTEGLPNYYSFVKPQLEQQRLNRNQGRRIHSLQQDVRLAATPGIASRNGGIPTTGHSTQFLNQGSYFPKK